MENSVMEMEQLIAMLAPLIALEREAENCQNIEEYHAFRRRIEDVNQVALEGLRQFIEDRPSWGIADMQSAYYFLSKHSALVNSKTDQGVLTSLVNKAWRWQRGWMS
ncbi:hypothetical protein JK182_03905 [Acetobacter okinawensis]|uniref:hypothetical protein n=1 Tax=Acetobacter okinawensis TaxID=1076594 RepID=UPI001BAE2546|nr:hypothetical protein [Acetobacter okinawensis]MBS0987835.1 hypothetical protein [Acetobacter okinawensis]